MRVRTTLALTAIGAAVLAPTAAHAAADTTNTTFTLTAGSLSIDAPTSANLGSVAASTTATSVSGNLGSTTVTDTRGSLVAAWQVTLSSGNFTTGSAGLNETVSGATVLGQSGTVTHTNTTATKVATETTSYVASAVPIAGLSAYSGTNTATYNPSVQIPIPVTNVAGTYSGVITQTVTAL